MNKDVFIKWRGLKEPKEENEDYDDVNDDSNENGFRDLEQQLLPQDQIEQLLVPSCSREEQLERQLEVLKYDQKELDIKQATIMSELNKLQQEENELLYNSMFDGDENAPALAPVDVVPAHVVAAASAAAAASSTDPLSASQPALLGQLQTQHAVREEKLLQINKANEANSIDLCDSDEEICANVGQHHAQSSQVTVKQENRVMVKNEEGNSRDMF